MICSHIQQSTRRILFALCAFSFDPERKQAKKQRKLLTNIQRQQSYHTAHCTRFNLIRETKKKLQTFVNDINDTHSTPSTHSLTHSLSHLALAYNRIEVLNLLINRVINNYLLIHLCIWGCDIMMFLSSIFPLLNASTAIQFEFIEYFCFFFLASLSLSLSIGFTTEIIIYNEHSLDTMRICDVTTFFSASL